MKFLFASDSFKGSLTSQECIHLLSQSARKYFPGCEIVGIPMADGGEGTVDAVLAASGGERCSVTVKGPLGDLTEAVYGLMPNQTAIMEMSAASGLTLVPAEKLSPLKASSFGTGQMVIDALNRGIRNVVLSIGGSATNDGGMGVMAALGVRFLDQKGHALEPIGENLGAVQRVDLTGLDPRLQETRIRIMCDVTNPLCGPRGATFVFGTQKGGTPQTLALLEAGMVHYARVLEQAAGRSIADLPGAGAAGGVGAALCSFCGAELVSGVETVLSLVKFDKKVVGADLVVTGEGRLDSQSARGKVVFGVGQRCKAHHVPAAAIVGSFQEDPDVVRSYGITQVYPLMQGDITLQQAIEQAKVLYARCADEMFRNFLNHTV